MLFGVLPFIGSSSSQIILAITTGKYQLPKHTLISDECKDLLQHMLEVNPKKRIKMSEIEDSPWLISTISPTISSRVKD